MRPSRLLLTLAAAATLVACGGDDDGAGTSNASTGETDASTGMSATTTVTTDMTSTMTTGMTTNSTDATTESGTTEPTTADSSSSGDSGTGGAACEPEVGDDACAMCEKMNCCDELVVCFDNPDCGCFADCYDVMGFNSDEACRMECMLDANPDEWADVFGCGMKHCLGDCI